MKSIISVNYPELWLGLNLLLSDIYICLQLSSPTLHAAVFRNPMTIGIYNISFEFHRSRRQNLHKIINIACETCKVRSLASLLSLFFVLPFSL